MKKNLSVLALACMAWLALVAGTHAQACKCAGEGARGWHPCNSYWDADVVFVGRVEEVGPVKWTEDGKSFTTRGRVTRLAVEESFRGVGSGTVEVVDGGTIYDYGFTVGKRYFVYGERDETSGKIQVCKCSQTNHLNASQDDLAFARSIARGELSPGIAGAVERLSRVNAGTLTHRVPLEGISVVAENGRRSFEATTDAAGVFLMYGVPAGEYLVRAKLPSELERFYPANRHKVRVADGRCGVTAFVVTTLATISGKVFEADGEPAKTKVSLIAIDDNGKEIRPAEGKVETHTYAAGNYKFTWVAPGRYLVAVNPRGQPASDDAPYPRAYLPGVRDANDAFVLTVRGDESLEAGEFRLPPPLRRETIEGVALWPDGRPASNAVVILEFTEREWTQEVNADKQGRFNLDIFEGFKYLVTAEVRKKRSATHSETVQVAVVPTNQLLTLTIVRPGYYVPRYARRRKGK